MHLIYMVDLYLSFRQKCVIFFCLVILQLSLRLTEQKLVYSSIKVEFDVNDCVDSEAMYDTPPEAEGGTDMPPVSYW